ncbi:MAG TPA: transporter substrate-binding domain-containing protein, partial [Alphaproteobacteria bacterium]|nr:transporter substrate-binding domain-containing protein [Alphaproteobacteria bacterium]
MLLAHGHVQPAPLGPADAPDGKPTGFDVDIAEAICAKLNRKCVYVEQVWDSMIPGLLA